MDLIEEAERAALTELFRRFPDSFVWVGGSLLHLLYHSPRASRDLDLAPLADVPEASALEDAVQTAIDAANEVLGTKLRAGGVDESVKGLVRILVEDATRSPVEPAFSIDISRINGVTTQTETVLIASALGSAAVRVPSESALLAQKLRALLLRRFPKPGDLFDCWFLLNRGVKLARLQREAFAGEAGEADIDERFDRFGNGRWLAALRRAGVAGLNEQSGSKIVDVVRGYVRGVLK